MLGTTTITYNGEKHTLRFNIAARFYLSEKFGTNSPDINEPMSGMDTFDVLVNVIEAGIHGYAKVNQIEPTMDTDDILNYLDTAHDDEIMALFTEWKKWFIAAAEGDENTEKKKI